MKDSDLMMRIFMTTRMHGRVFHSILEEKGIEGRMHEGMILYALSVNDGITQKELAQNLHIRPQSLTVTITKLEEDGFITRHRSEKDKREQIVSITEQGMERCNAISEVRDQTNLKMFSVLSDGEKEDLFRILEKVVSRDDEV